MAAVRTALAVLGALLARGSASAQQPPPSPCPSVFQYQTDGSQWTGLLQLASPPLGTTLRLNLRMSIAVQLPTSYVGRIELLGGETEILQQILRGGVLRYRVQFPLFSPLPRVTAIVFNGDLLCQGPPDRAAFVTSINLDHTLSTGNRRVPTLPTNSFGHSGEGFAHGLNGFNRPGNSYSQPGENYAHPGGGYSRPGDVYTRPTGGYNPPSYVHPVTAPPGNSYPGYEVTGEEPRNPYDGNNPIIVNVDGGTGFYNNETVALKPTGDGQNFFVVYNKRPNPDDFARPVKIDNNKNNVPERTTQRTPETTKCGVPSQVSNPLIVGGEATSRGEWPWLVAIFVKKVSSLEFVCAGSIVSNRHIVTAAHCVHSKGNRPVKVHEMVVKAGVFNLQDWTDENARTLSVSKVFLHPDFNGTQVLNKDISILVLSRALTYNQYITAVCLWEGDVDLSRVVGQKGVVVGWGRDENGLRATPEPRRADVTIVATDTCRASRPEFQVLTNENTLCAGDRDGSGPCNGDSGGGMFLSKGGRWMLRGIVSNSLSDPDSTNTCNLHEYIIFSDAAKYLSWIRSVIATN